ncbi:unnamed protein product, partial [Soboliphyme baturini]|uniref:BHLH domain-containing protein n=1 Tax=Soboliphyme baturini TaxID=241478 RepID=A0A183IHL9_9BILA
MEMKASVRSADTTVADHVTALKAPKPFGGREQAPAAAVYTYSTRPLNHSEIEKRRRDKMNAHIIEIGSLLPSSYNATQRLDKLSVLRLALQYIRHIHGKTI